MTSTSTHSHSHSLTAVLTAGMTLGGSALLAFSGQIPPRWLVWPFASALLALAMAGAMRWVPAVQRHSRRAIYGVFYATVAVMLGLCVGTGFSPALAIAYLFLLTILSIGGCVSSRSALAIGTCLAVSTAAGVAALVLSPEVEVERLVYGALLTAHGVALLSSTIVRVRDRGRLLAERELYHDIVVRTTDGVAIADAQTGAFLHVNPSFEFLTGGVSGRTTTDLFDYGGASPLDPEALEGLRALVHASGKTVPADLSVARVHYGGRVAIALVLRDASERADVERDLRTARDQAEAARCLAEEAREHAEEMLGMKSAFLANMSHELQTPLASIVGYADLLREEAPDTLAMPVEAIQEGADRLRQTISALLELADLEAGRLPVEHGTVDASALAADIVEAHRAQADARGLPLFFAAPAPAYALADRAALERTLSYLIDNALKFTESGRVAVVVAASGDDIEVAVRDSGIGMSEDDIGRAFAPFHQLSAGDARTHEGSGLGLSLARQLVEGMGGTLTVESNEGQGTLVRVRLPASPLPGDGSSSEYVVRPLFESIG